MPTRGLPRMPSSRIGLFGSNCLVHDLGTNPGRLSTLALTAWADRSLRRRRGLCVRRGLPVFRDSVSD
jgi:hypothetical protein